MAESAVLLDPPAAVDQEPAEQAAAEAGKANPPAEVLAADLLVEEISIDGMCGVY